MFLTAQLFDLLLENKAFLFLSNFFLLHHTYNLATKCVKILQYLIENIQNYVLVFNPKNEVVMMGKHVSSWTLQPEIQQKGTDFKQLHS